MQETQLWIYTRCSYNACAGSAVNGYLHLTYTPSTTPVQEIRTYYGSSPTLAVVTMPAQASTTPVQETYTQGTKYMSTCTETVQVEWWSCTPCWCNKTTYDAGHKIKEKGAEGAS